MREEAIKAEMKDSEYRPSKAAAAPSKKAEKPVGGGSKAAKWKAQSEMFRAALRAAKGAEEGPGNEAQVAAQQAIMEKYDDRTECKWCNRKFNEEAANRHIPLCEKKYKEM